MAGKIPLTSTVKNNKIRTTRGQQGSGRSSFLAFSYDNYADTVSLPRDQYTCKLSWK